MVGWAVFSTITSAIYINSRVLSIVVEETEIGVGENMFVVVEETEFGVGEIVSTLRLPYANAFPKKLKKLTLQNTFVPWEDIRTVSKLPKLEVLKLKIYNCRGTVWETIEDGFPQLKFLLLNGTDLALWKTNSDYFPCLECLVLGNCDSLHSRFCRYNHTLQLIELNMCKLSIVDSTRSWRQRLRRSCQKSNIPGEFQYFPDVTNNLLERKDITCNTCYNILIVI